MTPENKTPQTTTFTARGAYDPDKLATFTLQNGSVRVEFGEALLEQTEEALSKLDAEAGPVASFARPLATASMQTIMSPFDVQDFSAAVDGDSFQGVGWVRAAGLRLVPIVFKWRHVDNPAAAAAFVSELEARQRQKPANRRFPALWDYWAGWLTTAAALVALPLLLWQRLKKNRQGLDAA